MKRRQQSIGMTTAAATKSKSAAEEGIFVRPESSSEEDNGRESKNEFIASVFFENSASSLVPPPRKKISKEGGGGDGGDSSDISTTPNNHQRSPTAIVSTETEIPFPEPVIRMSTEPTTTTASVAAAAAAGFNQGYYHHKRHVSEGTYHHHHYHETTKVPELRHNRTNSEDVSSLFSSRQQQQRGGGGGGMLLIPSLQPPSRRNVSLEGNKQKSQPQILLQQHQQQESSSEEEVFPPVPPVRPPLRPPTSLLDTTTSPSTRLSSSAIQPPKRKSSSSGSTSSNEEQQQQVLLNHKDSVNSEYSEQSLPLSKLVVITDHNTTTNMIKRSTNTNTMTSSSSSVGIDANVNNDNTTITTTTTTTNEESFGSSQAIDISKHENSFTGKDNEYSVTSPQYHHHSEGGGGEGEGKGGGKQQQQQQQHHPQRLSSSDVMIAASIQHNPIIARLNDNNTTTKTQKFDVNLFPKSLVMEQQQQDIHLEEPERIISIEQQKQKGGGEGSSSGGGKKNNNHAAVSSSTSPLLSPVIIPPEASSTSVTLSPREVVLPQGSSPPPPPPPPVTAAVGTPTTRRKQQPGGLRESSPLSSSWAAIPPSSSSSPTLLLRTPTQGIRPNQIPPSLVMTQSTTIEPELTYSYSSPIIIIPTDEKTQYRNEPPLPIRRSPPSPTKIIHMTGSIEGYSSDEHEVLYVNGDGDDDGIKATGYNSQTIVIKKNKDVQEQEYIKGGNFRQIRREAKERQRRISHSDGSDQKTNKQERHPSSSVYPQQQHYEKGGNFRQIRKEVTSASPPRDRMNRTTTTGDQSEDDTALRRPTSSASPQDVKGGNFRRVQNDVKKKGQQRQNSGQSLSPHHQDRKSDNMNATAANHSGSPVGVKQSYTRQQQQQQGKHLGGGNDVVDEKKSYPLASGNVNRREQGNSRASDPTRATSRVSGKSIVDQDKPPNRQTSGPEVGEFSISQPTRHMYSAAKDKYTDNHNDKSHIWSISCPEVDESSRPKTIREINRERKERQKLSDLGEVSAVDLPNSHARTSGNSRERQIVQNEPDQQKNRYVRPPTSTAAVESTNAARIANRERRERNKMSDLGDGGAYDISPSQPRDITANNQEPEWNSRSIPRKEDASEEPIRSGSHTMVSSLPNFVSPTSTTMGPAVYSPEAHVRNHSGLMKAGASDRGDSQPLNFRAQRQLTDNSSEEYSACSDDENEDLVPGAFNVTTRGIEYRQNKGILTESQRFSSIATNSRASEGDSLAYSAKSGSSTAYSSKTSSFQQERRSTRNAPPTTNDAEAPALSATLQPSTADALVVDPDDGKKWFLRQPFLARLCICLVIVLAIAIAVPLVLSQNPSTPPPNSTPPATMAPSDVPSTAPTGLSVRAYEFIDIVQSVSAESDLTDPSQPQFKAVTWLADKDERNLYPSRETEEEKEIVERYIMALLYFAWNPQFTFIGFLSAAGYCGWNDSSEKGIFCKDSHISQIQLSGQGLDGAIPTEVFSLQYLDTLDLSDNFLTATIPSEIRFCTNLRDVNMGKQKKIPRLEGTIPSEIFSLPFLENLNLGSNSLNGTIPSAISNATRLRSFNIDVNKMSGTLPSGLGNLSNLEVLSLAVNKLNGSVPSDFFRMTNLVTLSMQDNPVTGTIQSEFGLFSNLRNLTLANTHLSGVLPSELGMLSTLEELNLRRVFVQDAIPTTLLELSSLRTLILDGTSLSDEAGVVQSLCNTKLPSPGEFSVGSTGIQCDCCGDP